MLVLILSSVGSLLTVLTALTIHDLFARSRGVDFIIVLIRTPRLFEYGYVFLLSLIVNLLGTLAVLAFFKVRRLVKPS